MRDLKMNENKDVACFFVTKHSWKGKYKRIFSVGTLGITTYNPTTMESTNQWAYKEFLNITPNTKNNLNNEFVITMKKGRKNDTMRFSSDHRADILTEALSFNALKYHWSGNSVPVVLDVTSASVDQVDPKSRTVLTSYLFRDLEGLCPLDNGENFNRGFVLLHGGFGRKHLFITDRRDEIMRLIVDAAAAHIGVPIKIKKDDLTLEDFIENKFGKFSSDECLTSICEFTVHKLSRRHEDPTKRLLCLTESCLLERNPATYAITTLKPLSEIFALIRCPDNPQRFDVEYVKGQISTYISTSRDALLASLLDGVRASGNKDVHVKMKFTNRGQRLGPLTSHMDEEVESNHLKFLHTSFLPSHWSFAEAVFRFNNNIPYSGLLHSITQDGLFAENKEKLITGALSSLLDNEGDQDNISLEVQEAQFQALRRLVASKIGFAAFTEIPKFREKLGLKVVKALRRNSEGVAHAAIDMLCALMQPMHDEYDLRQEQLNKSSLLSNKTFLDGLLERMVSHVTQGTGALYVASMLDFLTFALCTPYSDTTDGQLFDTLLNLIAEHGRSLFQLFQV
ncbi:DNAJC13 [Cordylochernes scorpioides]|uniref:DNAJC13 n=1 Tax=Cordylochernes scorpioides TaxID=51811 RepID=A0ABY6K2R4_9ARAC|nr:DNAJC13 [Cordylochernes scorpioides]